LGGRTIGSTSDYGSDTVPKKTNVLVGFIDTAGTYVRRHLTPSDAIWKFDYELDYDFAPK
jgi:hypothetical protein